MPRVLYVEDDPALRASVAAALTQGEAFDVDVASSARDALVTARMRPPDLVLLDTTLGDADAPELLSALRSVAGLDTTPVVFLAPAPNAEEKERLLASGAASVLEKPSPAEAGGLRDVLARILAE
ncbi:MAG: response regulator transcription factor [Acidobacteria bacterium]|nr:response regulator transcription factor [Acidobacteriota bacterium]